MLEDEINKITCSKEIEVMNWQEAPIKEVCLFQFNEGGDDLFMMVQTGKKSFYYKFEKNEFSIVGHSYCAEGDLVFYGFINSFTEEAKEKTSVGPFILCNEGVKQDPSKANFLESDLFKAYDFEKPSFWF